MQIPILCFSAQFSVLTSKEKTFPVCLTATICVFSLNTLNVTGQWYFPERRIQTNGPGHAKTCLMTYANNKGADQPAHPCSLITAFVVHCLDSIIPVLAITEISSL